MENVIQVHATNASLARTLDVLDPFVVTGFQTENQTAIDAGFETELDWITR
jgi:hypothetical protein